MSGCKSSQEGSRVSWFPPSLAKPEMRKRLEDKGSAHKTEQMSQGDSSRR